MDASWRLTLYSSPVTKAQPEWATRCTQSASVALAHKQGQASSQGPGT